MEEGKKVTRETHQVVQGRNNEGRASVVGMEVERTGHICKVLETESTRLPEGLNRGSKKKKKVEGIKYNF